MDEMRELATLNPRLTLRLSIGGCYSEGNAKINYYNGLEFKWRENSQGLE